MARTANLYDLCDPVLINHPPTTEPGRNLALIHRTLAGNPFLKHFLLKRCRHPAIPMVKVPTYQTVFRAALHATIENWRSAEWIRATMKPVNAGATTPAMFAKQFWRPDHLPAAGAPESVCVIAHRFAENEP